MVSKITKLTEKQIKGIIEWRDHCLEIGRDCGEVSKATTEKVWCSFYKKLNLQKPMFWYCQSPYQAQILINYFKTNIGENILGNIQGNIGININKNISKNISKNIGEDIFKKIQRNIRKNIRENIGDNIGENIGENILGNIQRNIRKNIRENIGLNIRENIRENISKNISKNIGENIGLNIRENIQGNISKNIGENISKNISKNIGENIGENIQGNIRENISKNISKNIGENIGENIQGNIRENIGEKIGEKIRGNIYFVPTYSWGQHDIGWVSYYLFYFHYGLLKKNEDFSIIKQWYELSKSCGWCYTFENIVFVCEKPSKININSSGELHKNGDMALQYSDGYGLYMLNGVSVPKYLAITPAGDLDIEFFKKEENADVKAEFVMKYGIDRMVEMGEVIDSYKNYNNGEWWEKSGYTLVDMSPIFRSIDYAPHILCKNQTTNIYHLEGIDPNCKNLQEAMNWRENTQKKKYKTIDIK